jgi:hypothetical protein
MYLVLSSAMSIGIIVLVLDLLSSEDLGEKSRRRTAQHI